MEYVKAFVKGLLEGAVVGGSACVLTNSYDNSIKAGCPKWLRYTVDGLLMGGSIFVGLKGINALEKYLSSEEDSLLEED